MTAICDLCIEREPYSKVFSKVGVIFYYRGKKPSIKVRIDKPLYRLDPIGLYLKDSEAVKAKFEEAPMVEGDIFARILGNKIKCGHVHSSQNEVGNTMYFIKSTRMDYLFKVVTSYDEVDSAWFEGVID